MRLQLTMPAPDAVASDVETRTISGQVVPYGVPGRTSIGSLSVDAGALTWPEDLRRVKLLREHDRSNPVGHALEAVDTRAGLAMDFRVARTPAGDLALLEASEGVRDALSVEIDDVAVTDGRITAGRLVAVAQVALPAYQDARVTRVAASQPEPQPDPDPQPEPEPQPATEDDPEMPDTVTAALVPAEHRGMARGTASLAQVEAALAARFRGDALSPDLSAALADITYTANSWAMAPQFASELWTSVPYARRIVPLVNNAALTGYKVVGWKWSVRPEVAPYTGDKADVPSNAAATVAVEEVAQRLAGAHDIDRVFWDFGDQAYINAYFTAAAADYALKTDAALANELEAAATVNAATVTDFWAAVLTGAMSVYAATGADATYALANPADIAALATVTTANAPALLNSNIGVGGSAGVGVPPIVPSSEITAGTVIVGTRMAATFYEHGGSPIRVEAVSLPDGGINVGVFGYYAVIVHAPGGLQKLTISAPVGRGGTESGRDQNNGR